MKNPLKKIFSLKRMYLLLLFPLSLMLVLAARISNTWVEHFFVPYIYKPISFAVGSVTSLLPFSVTELLAVAAIAFTVAYAVCFTVKCIKAPSRLKRRLYRLFINILCIVSVALFLFEMCMGLNYYRAYAADYLNLDVHDSEVSELYELTKSLALDLNRYREQMPEDENGVSRLSDSGRYETSKSARDAYHSLSESYPILKAADIRNKPLISSKLFSAFLTTGIYIPYTFESNINVDVPEFTIPATMCHELTHFRGFMRENEANFLGYLACMNSDRADFKYSASMLAFSYSYSQLSRSDKQLAAEVAALISNAVMRDIVFEDEYWEPYRHTVAAEASDKIYNSYLTANDQESGTRSYGEMVDLLLAYRRAHNNS